MSVWILTGGLRMVFDHPSGGASLLLDLLRSVDGVGAMWLVSIQAVVWMEVVMPFGGA